MHPLVSRSTIALAVVLAAGMANSASAQNSASAPTSPDLKARCTQLISYFDYYGTSRGENSDGARNPTRIAAGLVCEKGHSAERDAYLETLLQNHDFGVPPYPTRITPNTADPLSPH